MSDSFIFVLLLIAVALGYLFGRFSTRSRENSPTNQPENRYIKSIAHLLFEESDKEIESFIKSLDVNSDTIETHLALGNLLRKKGEVDRAIRIHQNLIARPSLSKKDQDLSQYELAVDFIRAGLLDRAESLLKELIKAKSTDKKIRIQSLESLFEIYVDTAEWLNAIDIADRLTIGKFSSTPDKWRKIQAHMCCELANEFIDKKDWMSARRWLRDSLRYDKNCVRASLIQANLEMSDGAFVSALVILRNIPHLAPEFASEAVPLMIQCFQELKSHDEMIQELKSIYKSNGDLFSLGKLSENMSSSHEAVTILLSELPKFGQFSNVNELLNITRKATFENSSLDDSLKKALLTLMDTASAYVCHSCGFEGKQMHWMCPSCKQWGSVFHV